MGLRILYNSKDLTYKTPFGVLTPGQECQMTVAIPKSCRTTKVTLVIRRENGQWYRDVAFTAMTEVDPYEHHRVKFSLEEPGLFFYFFRITTQNEEFGLYKYGDDTNMEDGGLWQLSCISTDYPVPEDFQGRVFYQIFPDRFHQAGACDCTDKLKPYWVHEDKSEMPVFRPDGKGEMLNNDFYGGNLNGIREKLPYLHDLGVRALYLNPIFMAFSTHRYDTADYRRIDPMLGTDDDFAALCREAHALDMKVILDGVFSHTGSNSRYFDREGVFGGGAYSDPDSPYRSWYRFQEYPSKYTSWWGFETLPCLDKFSPELRNYLFGDEDSVIAKWLRLGADGLRLDVADELPDDFLMALRVRLREIKPDAFLVGEVWEDASNKIAYDQRRRYFTAAQLDSVMNYPWRKAILDFVRGTDGGVALSHAVMTMAENYPAAVLNAGLNLLSSHDVSRAVTAILDPTDENREEQFRRMAAVTPEQFIWAKERFRLASFLQFTLPGCPCVYYGDEAGMTGYRDPFNRQYFPWGREDRDLQAWIRSLAGLKNSSEILQKGDVRVLYAEAGRFAFRRSWQGKSLTLWCNVSGSDWDANPRGKCIFGDLSLPPMSCCAMEE